MVIVYQQIKSTAREDCASGNSVRNTFKESRFNTSKGNPFDSKNRGP